MIENCGIVAISSSTNASEHLYFCLHSLQHRGQEASGIAVYTKNGIQCQKELGLVPESFEEKKLKGKNGIGHTYYSVKISSPENAQPTIVRTAKGDVAIAHNGIITNSSSLRKELMEEGHAFSPSSSEEELMAILLADGLDKGIERASRSMMKRIQGSYSLALMFDDRVFGIRDPLGIKPLCIGKFDSGYVMASESVAIDALNGKFIRDVEPGELIELTPNGYKSRQLIKNKERAHCFFEYVYFARSDSIIDGREVYATRKRMGEILAGEHPVEADAIVPIPDSGRTYAYGFSHASGIPIKEGLMKNRYITRTFIMPDQRMREISVRLKLNPVKSIVEGKKIVVVDDSIVRGTTMRKIVEMLKRSGAREVHVRIGSPPIIAPCYFGIDMTTRDQLIAPRKKIGEISKLIGANSLGYLSIDGMVEALRIPRDQLCLGCITGEYPVPIDGEKYRFQERLDKRWGYR